METEGTISTMAERKQLDIEKWGGVYLVGLELEVPGSRRQGPELSGYWLLRGLQQPSYSPFLSYESG